MYINESGTAIYYIDDLEGYSDMVGNLYEVKITKENSYFVTIMM
ncbi:MAG: hypothetical protein PUC65_13990 [Clostridiales bacterium]|nr:hypothetical protein [Clostridiales bacterium]